MTRFNATMLRFIRLCLGACALCTLTGQLAAQDISDTDPHLKPASHPFESPERFILELRGGPSSPDVTQNRDYGRFFRSDAGPHLNAQLDGIVYRMPRYFYLTAGAGIGLINFAGGALAQGTGLEVSEETTLTVIPVTALFGIRVDALTRKLHIPLIFAARVGWEWAHWDTNTGTRDDAAGWSLGPVLAAQVALDLDAIEPGGARNLDEEWGINHTYLFGEVYRFSPTSKSLPLGDTNWLIGLGFVL